MAEAAKALETAQPAQLSDALNKKRMENARGWFRYWIDAEGREFTSAARTLGLGENGRPVCSKFYHGKLDSDPTRIVLAIEALRAQLEGVDGVSRHVGWRETRCASDILKYAAAARDGHA